MSIRTVATVAQKSKITADGIEASAIPNPVKPGAIAYFSTTTAPEGWIKANGATISRTVYADLFAAIGTTHGAGDGSTTFNVPDLRGEFVRGLDDGRGVDTGRALGSAQGSQMQSHTHGVQSVSAYTGSGAGTQYWTSGMQSVSDFQTRTAGGTSNSSENRPRNVAMLACIKF